MATPLNLDILAHHLQRQAELRPDHHIMTFESPRRAERLVTYGSLWTYANRLAAIWQDHGLKKGDTVALLMRNYPEYIYAIVASSISGILSVAIDPRTRGEKLVHQLNKADSRIAMVTPDLVSELETQKVGTSLVDILVHTPEGSTRAEGDIFDLDALLNEPWPEVEQAVHSLADPHQIIYTSGTTGDPKAFVLDHSRALAAKNFIRLMDVAPDDVFYTGLSLTHANAQMMTAYPALWLGNHAVFSESFTKTRFWDICRRYGCTLTTSLGGIMSGLFAEPEQSDDADNPVRVFHSAGAPGAIWKAFEERFKVKIHEWYGTLEGGVATRFPNSDAPIGSFGKPLPGTWDMHIVREDFSLCEPFEIGQLIARPASGDPYAVVYYKDPEASAAKTRNGWLLSGDMVHADEAGWLYFDHRSGGGLRRNGDFVQPDYIERALAEHPMVDEVFVYGIEAASGAPGERDIIAAVKPRPDQDFDIGALFAKCRQDLETNFVPSFIQIVTEIPKTISEKPQERFLREALRTRSEQVYAEQDYRPD